MVAKIGDNGQWNSLKTKLEKFSLFTHKLPVLSRVKQTCENNDYENRSRTSKAMVSLNRCFVIIQNIGS